MVTSGAAGALTVGTAACITGADQQKILRIPDLTGMKSEVLIQKSHRYGYDHAVRATGARLVEIETLAELEAAAGDRTAMMLFFNDAGPRGKFSDAEWVRLGKKLNVPTFNDAAADVPPLENLSKYVKMGFDLVTFSGGKGIAGPQSAGLLLGAKDLIAAAFLNTWEPRYACPGHEGEQGRDTRYVGCARNVRETRSCGGVARMGTPVRRDRSRCQTIEDGGK